MSGAHTRKETELSFTKHARSAVNFDLATEALLDLLRQDALRKSTTMPSLSGDASPRSPREPSVLAEATKGKGLGLAEEYGTVEELLQRRASGAELEGALESLRDKGLSNTVLSNEEILLEIEEMSLDGTLGDMLPHRLDRHARSKIVNPTAPTRESLF